jgi:Zn-dependent protease with chaperone function
MVRRYARTQMGARLGHMLGDLGRVTVFLGSELLVMRMSRSREFYADAIGAALSSPDAMGRALQRLHGLAPTRTYEAPLWASDVYGRW